MTEDLSKQVLEAAELFHTVNNTEEWFLTIVSEHRLNFSFYPPFVLIRIRVIFVNKAIKNTHVLIYKFNIYGLNQEQAMGLFGRKLHKSVGRM